MGTFADVFDDGGGKRRSGIAARLCNETPGLERPAEQGVPGGSFRAVDGSESVRLLVLCTVTSKVCRCNVATLWAVTQAG